MPPKKNQKKNAPPGQPQEQQPSQLQGGLTREQQIQYRPPRPQFSSNIIEELRNQRLQQQQIQEQQQIQQQSYNRQPHHQDRRAYRYGQDIIEGVRELERQRGRGRGRGGRGRGGGQRRGSGGSGDGGGGGDDDGGGGQEEQQQQEPQYQPYIGPRAPERRSKVASKKQMKQGIAVDFDVLGNRRQVRYQDFSLQYQGGKKINQITNAAQKRRDRQRVARSYYINPIRHRYTQNDMPRPFYDYLIGRAQTILVNKSYKELRPLPLLSQERLKMQIFTHRFGGGFGGEVESQGMFDQLSAMYNQIIGNENRIIERVGFQLQGAYDNGQVINSFDVIIREDDDQEQNIPYDDIKSLIELMMENFTGWENTRYYDSRERPPDEPGDLPTKFNFIKIYIFSRDPIQQIRINDGGVRGGGGRGGRGSRGGRGGRGGGVQGGGQGGGRLTRGMKAFKSSISVNMDISTNTELIYGVNNPDYQIPRDFPCLAKIYLTLINYFMSEDEIKILPMNFKDTQDFKLCQDGNFNQFCEFICNEFGDSISIYLDQEAIWINQKERDSEPFTLESPIFTIVYQTFENHAFVAYYDEVIKRLKRKRRRYVLGPRTQGVNQFGTKKVKVRQVKNIYFDIETYTKNEKWDMKQQEEHIKQNIPAPQRNIRDLYGCGLQLPYLLVAKMEGEDFVNYWGEDCCERFIKDLIQYSSDYPDINIAVWSFNGAKFDNLFLLECLIQKYQHIKALGTKSDLKIIMVGKNLIFGDLRLVCPVGSLNQTCKALQIPQQKIDFNVANFSKEDYELNKEKIIQYCQQDVYILELINNKLMDFKRQFNVSNPTYTAASTSVAILQFKYLNDWLSGSQDWQQYKIEKSSMMGGVVISRFQGVYKGKIIVLDINSSYPNALKNGIFGDKLIIQHNFDQHHPLTYNYYEADIFNNSFDINGIQNHFLYLIECDYHPEQQFPLMAGRYVDCQLLYTLHVPQSWRWGYDLNSAIKNKQLSHLSVFAIREYTECKPFQNFITDIYTIRAEAKETGNEGLSTFCKLIMNSLYGKFCSKFHPESIWCNQETMLTHMERSDIDQIEEITENNFRIQFKDNDKINNIGALIRFSAQVTAYARSVLNEMICNVGSENVLYVDTDSVFIREDAYQKVNPNLIGDELGQWKPEFYADKATFINNKVYYLEGVDDRGVRNEKMKCKGFHNAKLRVLGKYFYQQLVNQHHIHVYNENVFRRQIGGVSIEDVPKKIKYLNSSRYFMIDENEVLENLDTEEGQYSRPYYDVAEYYTHKEKMIKREEAIIKIFEESHEQQILQQLSPEDYQKYRQQFNHQQQQHNFNI